MPKSTLIYTFSFSLLTLTIPLVQAIDSNLEQPANNSQLITVSSDIYSNPEYTFISSLILRTYPELMNTSLEEIKQKKDEKIGQILYLFIYDNSSNSSDSNATVKQVTVLTHQHGTLYSVLEGSRAVDTYYRQRQEPMIVGGDRTLDTQSLDLIENEAKLFLTNNLPYLQKWQLVSIRTQVVAGKYICFAFQDTQTLSKEEYCVLSQPWLNGYLQLTTADGTIYTKGGFGCDPQSRAQNNTSSGKAKSQELSIANESNGDPFSFPFNPDTKYPSQSVSSAPSSSPGIDAPRQSSTENASNSEIPQQSKGPSPIFNLIPASSTASEPSSQTNGFTPGGSISLLPPISTLPSPSQLVPISNFTIQLPPANPNGLQRLLLTLP